MSNKKDTYQFTETGLYPRLKRFKPDHEYEWDKVCRERKENHPKFLGGNYHDIPKPLAATQAMKSPADWTGQRNPKP